MLLPFDITDLHRSRSALAQVLATGIQSLPDKKTASVREDAKKGEPLYKFGTR